MNASIALLVWALCACPAAAGEPARAALRDANGQPTPRTVDPAAMWVDGASWVVARPGPNEPQALGRLAARAGAWIDAHPADPAVQPNAGAQVGITPAQLRATLAAVVQITEEDARTGANRLADPAFIAAHFVWMSLQPHRARGLAPPTGAPEALRLTRYLVTQREGRTHPDGAFRHALYADPGEAVRMASTRAEVMAGAWDRAGARPLVYLTEAGVYDALLQGTVAVRTPDGATSLYNVDRPNGHAYRPTVRDPAQQLRYWSFRPVHGALGYGVADDKIELEPMVSVAGDVMNLGLGALLAIETPAGPRLVILADTGGAFVENIAQLDLFGGSFPSHAALYAATAAVPQRTAVALLMWRGTTSGP